MKRDLTLLLVMNILYVFITASLSVVVPLYLNYKNVDITLIGLILSLLPLIFMVLRLFFSSVADEIGTKTISVFYSLSNIVAIVLYTISTTSLGFASASLMEGVRESGFWAVTRTDVLENSKSEKERGQLLSYFSGFRQFADTLGRLSVGIILVYFAFTNIFFFLMGLAFVFFLITLTLRNKKTKPFSLNKNILSRIFKPRPFEFWRNAFVLMLISLPQNILMGFLLPLYLHNARDFSYSQTGLAIALLSFVIAMATLIPVKFKIPLKYLVLLTILVAPSFLLLPFSSSTIFLGIIAIGITIGCGNVLYEHIVLESIAKSSDVSTDIGTLVIPLRIGEFLLLGFGGFIVSAFGYISLFAICAVIAALSIPFFLSRTYKSFSIS